MNPIKENRLGIFVISHDLIDYHFGSTDFIPGGEDDFYMKGC